MTAPNIPISTSAPQQPQNKPTENIKGWRLWLPLTIQALLVIAIGIPPLITELSGKIVILKTAPVDPYDPLRGYSQTLSYDISRIDNLKKLPGWKDLPKQSYGEYLEPRTSFYVIMQAPGTNIKTNAQTPQPWKPVAIKLIVDNSKSVTFNPATLPPNQIAIRGRTNYGSVEYGLETYYMPEEIHDQINQEVSQASRNQTSFVEIKVNSEGRAVPIKLWLGDKSYRF
jgi:uncharacterized membrane-anchored protein